MNKMRTGLQKTKYYIYLHICILIFSFTEIFGKLAALTYNEQGLYSVKLFIYIFLMLFVCLFYAFCWQKIIKHFDLHIGYANRSVYLIWSQIWAVVLFSEHVTTKNIIGMLIVMLGVIMVSFGGQSEEEVY